MRPSNHDATPQVRVSLAAPHIQRGHLRGPIRHGDASQYKEIDAKSEIARVATISAADTSVGQTLADAIDRVGKDGIVTVEESNTFGLELEFTEGMQFDKGYISAYFVTDPERLESV